MALDFAPGAPGTLGMSWFATKQGSQSLASDADAVAIAIASTATETIASLSTYVDNLGGDTSAPLMVEIFEAGSEVPGAVTTTIFRPNSTIVNGSSNWWKNGWLGRGTYSVNFDYVAGDVVRYLGAKYLCILTNGPGTAHAPFHLPSDATYWTNIQSISMQGPVQESTLDPTDYVRYEGGHSDYSPIQWGFDTSAWVGSGARRITDVRLMFYASTQEDEFTLKPTYTDGDSPFPQKFTGLVIGDSIDLFEADFGPMHPDGSSTAPWTDADIAALDSTEGFGFKPWNGKSRGLRVYQVWIEVDWVTENRKAYGTLANLPAVITTDGLVTLPLIKPNAGAANWAKLNTTDYTALFRRVPMLNGSGLTCGVRYLESVVGPPPQVSYLPTLSGGLVTTLGDEQDRGIPQVGVTTVPGNSVDAMPYVFTRIAPILTFVKSDFVATATEGGYRLVRAVVVLSQDPNPDPLQISIHKTSDDSIQSGVASLTRAEIAAFPLIGSTPSTNSHVTTGEPDRWYLVEVEIPGSASLTSATEYYVKFSGDALYPYYVAALNTAAFASDRSYGGTAACLNEASTPLTYLDGLVTVATMPDPPEDFTATTITGALSGDGSGCSIDTLDYAQVSWTPTSLGDDFAGYEIQRIDRATVHPGQWDDVALITTEEVWFWRDFEGVTEGVSGQFSEYRMRVLRADGSRSDWTLGAYASVDSPSCGWYLTSNLRPDLSLGYQDIGSRVFNFADAEATKFSTRYSRDYQTVAYPLELGSDGIPLSLIVFAQKETATSDAGGRTVFDPLMRTASESVSRETKVVLPYLCLRNEAGNRWYGQLVVESGQWDAEFEQYIATCTFTSTRDTPLPVDVELTGQMVLARGEGWWDARSISAGDTELANLARGTAGPMTLEGGTVVQTQPLIPIPLIADDVTRLWLPGWDDMWASVPIPEVSTGIDIRWDGKFPVELDIYSPPLNWLGAQGSDDTDASWAVQQLTTGEIVFWWSEDGNDWQFLSGGTPSFGIGLGRVMVQFDPSTGNLTTYEQPHYLAPSLMDLPHDADNAGWTPIASVSAGATTLWDSAADVRLSCGPVGDDYEYVVDGVQTVTRGHLYRYTLRLLDGTVIADLDLSTVNLPLTWVDQGGYPSVGGVTTAEEAAIFGRAGEEWTLHIMDTTSIPPVIVDRTSVIFGNADYAKVTASSAVDFAEEAFTLVLGERGTRAHLDHGRLFHYDAGAGSVGYKIRKGSGVDSPSLVVDDGPDSADVSSGVTVALGTVTSTVAVWDHAHSKVYTNGEEDSTLIGDVDSISTPGSDLTLYSNLSTDLYSGEWFTTGVLRFAVTEAEAQAIADYIADPTANTDGYTPS